MSSEYCTKAQIEDVFGVENVSQWSDLANTGSADTDRITRALNVASEEIDDVARVSTYKVPLSDQSGDISVSVSNLAATLAGIWLYESRGSQDFNPQTGEATHRFEFLRNNARQKLNDIRDQRIRVKAEKG